MRPKLILLIVFASFGFTGVTQSLLRYHFTQVTPDQGLSSTYVRKIVQDPYGFIWAGTQDGLNRFDGKRLRIYTKSTNKKYALAGTDIRDLLIDSTRSTLWVITSYGGINGIDYRTGRVWFTYEQQNSEQWKHTLLNALLLAGDQLYIGSSAGLLRLNMAPGSLEKVSFLPCLPENRPVNIERLVPTKGRGSWIITEDQGVLYADLNAKKLIARSLVDTAKPDRFNTYDAILLNQDEILLATSRGVQKAQLRKDRVVMDARPYSFLPSSFTRETFACYQEASGAILLSSAQLLVRVQPGKKAYIILAENTSSDTEKWLSSVYAILSDRRGVLWIGSQKGLAYCANMPSPFYRVYQSSRSTTRIEHAYYIYPVNDSVLFSCAQNGLYRVSLASGDITAIKEGTPFYHVFRSPFNDFIVSSRQGASLLKNGLLLPLGKQYPELARLGTLVFNSHVQPNDSLLVLGTNNFKGIVVWNFRQKSAYRVHESAAGTRLAENVVNGLYLDNKGNVWVLGDHSISVLDKTLHTVRNLVPYHPKKKKYYSIFFDVTQANSCFYIASYGNGVLVLDSAYRFLREMTAPEDLTANSVYKTLAYRDSLLLVTTNNGIALTHLKSTIAPAFYFRTDGLHSNTFEENSGTVYNGKIYAGGEKGLTVIDPALLREDRLPPLLYLDEIKLERPGAVQSFTDLTVQQLEIPKDVVQTTLSFCALDYPQASKITYAYKIDELHEGWINLGTRNVIPLIGLRPGAYTVRVKAANGSGVETIRPLHIRLYFLPKWYQTWWFKAGIGVVLVYLLLAFYWYRMAQLKKQERIRKNIASDLHDDIGSTLNSIKIFTHLAKTNPGSKEYLLQIEDSVQQTSMSLRDIIWVLDDTADTAQELMERLRKFALPLCKAKGIALRSQLQAETSHTLLTKEEKRNLLLIAKESVNNAVKYADCCVIEVYFVVGKLFKKLTITDNGKGFDTESASSGNGLKNMHYRASQLSYTLTIDSSEKGTVVSLYKQL